MAARQPRSAGHAVRIVAGNLKVDCGPAEALRAFDVMGVQSVVVKGSSVVRWLYDPTSRGRPSRPAGFARHVRFAAAVACSPSTAGFHAAAASWSIRH